MPNKFTLLGEATHEIATPPSIAPCGIHSIHGNKKAPKYRSFFIIQFFVLFVFTDKSKRQQNQI